MDVRLAVPHPPKVYVERPRLDAILDAGAELPLTLVSAPAGTGKTALVAAWAARRAAGAAADPVAWVSLEPADLPRAEFWSLVAGSLRDRGVRLPAAVTSPTAGDLGMLTELSSALARSGRPVVLVLDNCDVTDLELAADLEFVLGHSGRQLRLVMITRVDPVLPLHRFRLSDSMCELRMADLAFHSDEVSNLVERSGLDLSAESVDTLVDRTHGWAAGLRFACMHLAGSADPGAAVDGLAGDTGNIAEFLMSEILQTLEPDDRRLLLRTSVVDVLRPGLVEVLGGRSAARGLAALARANVLVEEVPGPPGWYRYHPFLRDLLRAELAYSSPSRVRRLHQRAAAWFAGQGLVPDAVAHAVAARAWADAAAYAVDGLWVAHLVTGVDVGGVVTALRPTPAAAAGPHTAAVRAARAFVDRDFGRCGDELARGREAWDRETDGDGQLDLTLDIIETLHAGATDSPGARERADRLTRRLASRTSKLDGEAELLALTRTNVVVSGLRTGELATVGDADIIEPLTAKEREVLGHLSELLSTEEIAATMFVSVNTVRTHIRSILRKLAVSRRNDAIRRARALDLIGS